MKVYSGRVEALESILQFLKNKKEKYVIMTDANIAVDFDFNDMLRAHIESGADVTVAYAEQEIPAELIHAGAHGDHVLHVKARGRACEKDLHEFRGERKTESFHEHLYYGKRSSDREDPCGVCTRLFLF